MNELRLRQRLSLIFITGFALFAMFFGAGNIVFPIMLGVSAGQNINVSLAAFLLSGVAVPFFGLYVMSLYRGDYQDFFAKLGKWPAIILITFILMVIGPLFAGPRTEVITYHTLLPYLPGALLQNKYFFDLFYYTLVFFLVCRGGKVVDYIGRFISPIKLVSFLTLIVIGLTLMHHTTRSVQTSWHSAKYALSIGYSTMDLMGAFFYCNVAYLSILHKCKQQVKNPEAVSKSLIKWSCLVGAACFAIIYIGLMVIAHLHAGQLQHVPPARLIQALSHLILGEYGSIFVCICVFLACLATASALLEVSTYFFCVTIFKNKVPRLLCMSILLATMYAMSLIGFSGILKIALPILNYVYPILIVVCVINFFEKVVFNRNIKWPSFTIAPRKVKNERS